jgi:hypothetical protein
MTKKRIYERTAISLAPMTVDEALASLLKTPPPPEDHPSRKVTTQAPKKAVKKKTRARR